MTRSPISAVGIAVGMGAVLAFSTACTPSATAPGLVPSEMEQFVSDTAEVSDPLLGLQESYPDVFSRFSVDDRTQTLTFGYASGSSEARVRAFKAATASILKDHSYRVVFEARPYALAELEAVSAKMTREHEVWLPRFGNEPYVAVPDLDGDGVVRVFTSGSVPDAWRKFEWDGVPVEVVIEENQVIAGQTRLDEVSPQ